MKKALVFLTLNILTIVSFATNYYISASSGSDSNNGLSPASPKQTLTAVNSLATNPGDSVLFKAGDGWYGQLVINRSGSALNSIVYSRYGEGSAPTITGFLVVSSWTDTGSNIWESSSAVTSLSTLNMVSVNGVNTAMGRYPNAEYLTFESHSSNTSITDNQLSGTPNWTGAEVVIRPVRWIFDRRTVASHSAGTLGFSALTYVPIDGFGYFIQNDVRTLDAPGEWYFNPTTKKLKIYSTAQPTNVKVASIDDICTITASYITIDGISFTGSNDELITGNATVRSNIVIKNCTLSFSGSDAISGLNTNNSTLDGNSVSNINNNGIGIDGTGNLIQHNALSSIGLFPGMGTLIYMGITAGSSTTIQYNTVQNVGYIGISFYGNDILVKNNLVDTYCQVLDDGGGIYTYTGARTAMTNCRITGNIVLNGIGAIAGTAGNQSSTAIGIYLDNNTKNTEVDNNTIAHTNTYGMLMNNPSYINIHDNKFYDNSPHIRSTFMTGSNAVTNMIVTGNWFVSKAGQGMFHMISSEENLSSFGVVDNNVYARPTDDIGEMFITSQPSALYQSRTFASWKTYLSKDINSKQSPKQVPDSDVYMGYNSSLNTIMYDLPFPGVSPDGKRLLGSVSLSPMSSVIVFKDLTNSTGQLKYMKTPSNLLLTTPEGLILGGF